MNWGAASYRYAALRFSWKWIPAFAGMTHTACAGMTGGQTRRPSLLRRNDGTHGKDKKC
jgi:hypothetical protein